MEVVDLNKYTLNEKLGEGGSKVAYKATDKFTGEEVCLSVFRSILKPGTERLDYEDEIATGCMDFMHPNLIRTISRGQKSLTSEGSVRQVYFTVTELCSKGELFDFVEASQGLSEIDAKPLFRQILAGLAYLHERGVAHRDMKLENCFLNQKMEVKVADFGLAARCGKKLQKKVGSEGKMAPEMLGGEEYEGLPVDVFACGVMLFEMLTGEIPFNEALDSDYKLFMIDAENQLKRRKLSIGSDALDLILKMLSVDPTKRITLSQIRTHAWLNSSPEPAEVSIPLPQQLAQKAVQFALSQLYGNLTI